MSCAPRSRPKRTRSSSSNAITTNQTRDRLTERMPSRALQSMCGVAYQQLARR